MKQHKGMRPLDVIILLKLAIDNDEGSRIKDLSSKLFISGSEVSESLNRSSIAGLLLPDSRTVNKEAFLKFLEHGLQYVFPAQLGPVMKGMFTAHSESSLYLSFSSEEKLVWADELGKERGSTILPLYPTVVKAVKKDRILYRLLALCDIIRVGDQSDKNKAVWHLREAFQGRA
ncbi:hypothetical protein [Daejeonella lutea]|uniref:Uncharacterized protein n=1 Tax=Daejeonella lutea TaxID=572036 RepID=A0A1T5DI22_9SPHI|nr:hypothetical protein [Daejeonella lutea]SKB71287.1 hypothetical protein SAMN05661099_2358 [Daejeonella lutea]